MTRALIFPGQGSQAVGMGRELWEAFAAAREVFQEVDDALNQELSRLIFEGPESDLVLTENAQPALMAMSVAAVRALEAEGRRELGQMCAYVAGHSLGEYSALAAAGAIGLADTARLLRTRGIAMQRAVPVGEGAMAALIGVDLEAANEIAAAAAESEVCAAANDNAPGQVVISGHTAAVERAVALASSRGAKRSIMLAVSAPFHCALMRPAAEEMEEALQLVSIAPPVVPLVANVTARAVSDPETIRRRLVEQVTGLVRWRESVLFMREMGVDTMVECGAGRVLSGICRRIERDLATHSAATAAEIEAVLRVLA
ncbi:MAG: ACP S-malonyltransferase [Alphaproteobacteria bacterium]|nr:ACP S-malonyltransferase [Alphaproteobacteria bacterium]